MKVFIWPLFGNVDKGDGGIRRVVEAQKRHLPNLGVEIVDKAADADVIAGHISIPPKWLRMYPEKAFVAHNHGLYWDQYTWADWALRANKDCLDAIKVADVVTAPSLWVAKTITRHTMRPAVVVNHGVDMADWPSTTVKNGKVLWNKTRVDPVCDPGPVAKLAQMAPDVQFVSTLGDVMPDNVKVVGVTSWEKAKKDVQECAVYLCTTRETFGIGTIEAMAAGAPILGWRWGGQEEFIEHEVTGYLARPEDYEDLERGLRYCLANQKRMGKAARSYVQKHFKWEEVVKEYVSVYEEAMERRYAKRPRVSVVVPAYNLERYLPEALDSVLAQTTDDWECIIVDDASPDDTARIADQYAAEDKRFRVIHNEENQYLAGALNTGIAAARGRYIVPLDADNMLPPEAVDTMAYALDTRREIHIAFGNVEFLEEDGKRWHSGWPPKFRPEWQVIRRRDDGQPSNTIPSTAMFRKEVWEYTGGYRRRWRTSEDADFWTRAVSYGFMADMVTDSDTLIYRNREGSMSRVEKVRDYTAWMPWTRDQAHLPAGFPKGLPTRDVALHEPPYVSVVIPVGPDHAEHYIDAVDSVLAQTFPNWECIIVNDTGKPLRWEPAFARILQTEGRVGVAKARNIALSVTRAPLFIPLDADDTLEPQALATFLNAYEPGHYVYSSWYELFEDEKKTWSPPPYDANKLKKGSLHAVTALYPVAAWREVGGFADVPWEDWDFQIALAHACVCGIYVDQPLFTYRKYTGTRRESNYADFDTNKETINLKWKAFFDAEGDSDMGCGCRGTTIKPQQQKQMRALKPEAAVSDPDEYVIIEYIGAKQAGVLYRGQSGTQYRFGANKTERQKYVRKIDSQMFLLRVDFREVVRDAPEGIGTGVSVT